MDTKAVLTQVLKEYEHYLETDPKVDVLYRLLKAGKAGHKQALQLAQETGGSLADSLISAILPGLGPDETISVDDALAVIPQALRSNHRYVNEYLAQVQRRLNESAGIGLQPVNAAFDETGARIIAKEVAKDFRKAVKEFKTEVKTFSAHTVDSSIRANAKAQTEAGLNVTVTRIYDGVGLSNGRTCQWCLDRCGTDMPYSEAYEKGAFERHPGCGCELLYKVNKRVQRQIDWTSNKWEDVTDEKALEKRKTYGL